MIDEVLPYLDEVRRMIDEVLPMIGKVRQQIGKVRPYRGEVRPVIDEVSRYRRAKRSNTSKNGRFSTWWVDLSYGKAKKWGVQNFFSKQNG